MDGSKQHMVLDGIPVNLCMLQDVWQYKPDFKDEASIVIYRKINKGVFLLNANTLLRPLEAMQVFLQSILAMLKNYKL